MIENIKSLDFLGFPEYSITDKGVVYSHFDINYENKHIRGKLVNKNIRKPINPIKLQTPNQHLQVRLSNFGKRHIYKIHYLVALAFVPNPNNFQDVKFKDENIYNIDSSNLEWCPILECTKPGYEFINKQGLKCTVLNRHDVKNLTVSIYSDNVVGDIKGIILTTSIKSVRNKSVQHPYFPTVHGVGCIGLGPYLASTVTNGVEVRDTIYTRWSQMIARCCIRGRSELYYGTPISEEFKNYQNYAAFINNLKRKHGIDDLTDFEIDKDFKAHLGVGYSRETISIIPLCLNLFIAKRTGFTGTLPLGVSYVPTRDEFRSAILDENKVTVAWYRTSDDMIVNIDNINKLLDIYIKAKIVTAKELFNHVKYTYPTYIFDSEVSNTLLNFDKFLINQVYKKAGWDVVIENNNYCLTGTMRSKIESNLFSSGFNYGIRKKKLYPPK